jgi:magnesium transporter
MKAAQMSARQFAANHPDETARLLEQYAPQETAEFLDSLTAPVAAAVVSHMIHMHGAECLASMAAERAGAVATALAPSILAALLRRLTMERREALLNSVSSDLRRLVERLLTFAGDTVGAVTDPDIVTLPESITVSETRRYLRRHQGTYHHHLYVTGENRQLAGVVHVGELMRADSKLSLSGLMEPAPFRLPASGSLASARLHPAWNRLDAMPVVDDTGMLLGVVRHRQLRGEQASPGTVGLVGALLGLGELYWIGLSAFLPVSPQDKLVGIRSRAGVQNE